MNWYCIPEIEIVLHIFLIWTKYNKYMLRAMTKPALMTFSNIKAINFYFNAKLTDFFDVFISI